MPSSCENLWNPSEQCEQDLQAQNEVEAYGGGLKFEGDHQCGGNQQQLETDAWDALTLAKFGATDPSTAKEIATWKAYIGPDYAVQQQRIVNNLRRVEDHRLNKKFDIIVSCKDTKNRCGNRIDGKSVGGYAWTYKGWTGHYYYITLCPVYFGIDTFQNKTKEIQERIPAGDTRFGNEAEWQKHRGLFFLHEMMHLDSVGDPHITDEYVQEDKTGPRAYGPRLVYKLAQRPLNQGGGATRASTNADSYAWLVNSLYFYDLTGYFPAPPRYRGSGGSIDDVSAEDEARAQDGFPVHLGTFGPGEATDDAVNARFDLQLEGMKTQVPAAPTGPSCKSDNECSSPSCAGGGVVYSCVQGTCQCGFPTPPGPPPEGLKCFEDVSEEECTGGKYVCPEGSRGPGCVKKSLLETFWCTCY